MVFHKKKTWPCLQQKTSPASRLRSMDAIGESFLKTFLRLPYNFRLLLGMAVLVYLTTTPMTVAHSAVYYIAPNGTNSNFTGSYDKPWQSFEFAIPKLEPGDTLILKDGTYESRNNWFPDIDCSRGANTGTRELPITIKAENERRAFINGNGTHPPFSIRNCSYWNIEGLHARSRDIKEVKLGRGDVVKVENSTNIKFKRLLLTHNNRYVNSQLLSIANSDNILVEESEFYWFQRHAILFGHTNNSIARRNYANSRGYSDIPGGWGSTGWKRGQAVLTVYPGSNNIGENNVSEGQRTGISISASDETVGNKFFGNISLNDFYGMLIVSRGTGTKLMPRNTVIENAVIVAPSFYGIWGRGNKNTQVKSSSIFGGEAGILADYEKTNVGDGLYSFFSKNTLVHQVGTYGFRMVGQKEFSHKFAASYKPKVNFSPNYNYFNEQTSDPMLGTCKVFIPRNSSLKDKGEMGADIGANILNRYEEGVLTNQPLWNPQTGEFPGGAIVKGVNDISGSSRFDVHKRLNVNSNGCLLP